jgi:hypothetical protein
MVPGLARRLVFGTSGSFASLDRKIAAAVMRA